MDDSDEPDPRGRWATGAAVAGATLAGIGWLVLLPLAGLIVRAQLSSPAHPLDLSAAIVLLASAAGAFGLVCGALWAASHRSPLAFVLAILSWVGLLGEMGMLMTGLVLLARHY